MDLDSKIPPGPLEKKWAYAKSHYKLVNPANKRKYDVIVVGAGLAGAAAAATMGELGYNVKCFVYHDSPRRAHSIAAQGVPFAREYGGLLENRSFGGVQVSRTFYARGQTGQQLLLGAFQALERQIALGRVTMFPRHDVLDIVIVDGQAKGIVTRNLVTGAIETHAGDAVVLGTGGYVNVFYLSTNAKASNATAIWRAYKRGAHFANPCYTQIHPTCIPQTGDYQSKLTLMSESLRNDGRVWVPRHAGDNRPPAQIP